MGDLTAKTFEKPLLVTLAQLSGSLPEVAVDLESTYQPVMDRLGIADANAYGNNEATGIPKVVKWIQWAFQALKDQDLAVQMGRGKWGLTLAGISEASKLEGSMNAVTTSAQTPMAPVPAPVVVTQDPPDALSIPYGKGFGDNDSYHPDPYIRKLALAQCSCKGGWAERSPACKVCTFTGTCRNVQAALISQLAKTLAAEDAAGVAPVTPAVATPTATTVPVIPQPTGPSPGIGFNRDLYDLTKMDSIVVQVDTPCSYCQNPLKKREKGVWVEPKAGYQAEIGIFHVACFDAVKAGA